jgi:hypothetical protein
MQYNAYATYRSAAVTHHLLVNTTVIYMLRIRCALFTACDNVLSATNRTEGEYESDVSETLHISSTQATVLMEVAAGTWVSTCIGTDLAAVVREVSPNARFSCDGAGCCCCCRCGDTRDKVGEPPRAHAPQPAHPRTHRRPSLLQQHNKRHPGMNNRPKLL